VGAGAGADGADSAGDAGAAGSTGGDGANGADGAAGTAGAGRATGGAMLRVSRNAGIHDGGSVAGALNAANPRGQDGGNPSHNCSPGGSIHSPRPLVARPLGVSTGHPIRACCQDQVSTSSVMNAGTAAGASTAQRPASGPSRLSGEHGPVENRLQVLVPGIPVNDGACDMQNALSTDAPHENQPAGHLNLAAGNSSSLSSLAGRQEASGVGRESGNASGDGAGSSAATPRDMSLGTGGVAMVTSPAVPDVGVVGCHLHPMAGSTETEASLSPPVESYVRATLDQLHCWEKELLDDHRHASNHRKLPVWAGYAESHHVLNCDNQVLSIWRIWRKRITGLKAEDIEFFQLWIHKMQKVQNFQVPVKICTFFCVCALPYLFCM